MDVHGISQAGTALCGPFGANAIVVSLLDCTKARLLPGVLAEIVCDEFPQSPVALGHIWPGPGVADGQIQVGGNIFRLLRGIIDHARPSTPTWSIRPCQPQQPPSPASSLSLSPTSASYEESMAPKTDTIKLHLAGALVCGGMTVVLPPSTAASTASVLASPAAATGSATQRQAPATPPAAGTPSERTVLAPGTPTTPQRWSPSSAAGTPPLLHTSSAVLLPFSITVTPAAPAVHQFLSSWTHIHVGSTATGGPPSAGTVGPPLQQPTGGRGALPQILEAIQLVFKPEAWQVFHASSGCAPPRGVLLQGPPGTGKSTLAKQAAAALGAQLLRLDGVQLAGQAPHLARASIAEAFGLLPDSLQPDNRVQWFRPPAVVSSLPPSQTDTEAPHGGSSSDSDDPSAATVGYVPVVPPRVVVIDELDALAVGATQGGAHGDQGGVIDAAGASLLATLKACLENSYKSSYVLPIALIGTTNRPESVAKSVLGPSGFVAPVSVPPPSSTGRLAVLQSLFPPHLHAQELSGGQVGGSGGSSVVRGHPHNLSHSELQDIADSTNGYVAADLASLANEAALSALQRQQHMHASAAAAAGPPHITFEDIQAARPQVQASALRELQVDIPRTKWDDVAGAQDAKAVLQETVQWPLQHPQLFMQAGVSPPVGVLLYGPPGTGKTLLAKALAHETRANFISVKGPELFSMYVGDSEKAVQRVFRQAAAVAPCVVFIDEVDAMGRARGSQGDGTSSNVSDRVLNQLLTEMDTLHHAFQETVASGGDAADWLANRVVVVAATNRPDTLDAALVRPGRLEQLVYVGLPDVSARESLLRHALSKASPDAVAADVDLAAVAGLLHNASGAECAGVVRAACLAALQRDVHKAVVTQADLQAAAQSSVPQCTPQLLQWYASWKST